METGECLELVVELDHEGGACLEEEALRSGVRPSGGQVWSLTQFYSVDFSKSRIDVKKCVFNEHIIKVYVSCC